MRSSQVGCGSLFGNLLLGCCVVLLVAGCRDGLNWHPPGTGGVSGTVVVAGSSSSIAGALVYVPGRDRQAYTGSDGSFEIRGIPTAESVTIAAIKQGYGSASVTAVVVDGEVTPLAEAIELTATTVNPVQFGVQIGSDQRDSINVVQVTESHVWVGGATAGDWFDTLSGSGEDAFVARLAFDGTIVDSKQIGTDSNDAVMDGVLNDNGTFYCVGTTEGKIGSDPAIGDEDFFLLAAEPAGSVSVLAQRGSTGDDDANAVARHPDGDLVICGSTFGDLDGPGSHAGDSDAFVARYTSDGTEVWLNQLGTNEWDVFTDVTVDADGNVYVVGNTYGDLFGTNSGAPDIIYASYSFTDGSARWEKQTGTADSEVAQTVAIDAEGRLAVAGGHTGDFSFPRLGTGWDGFLFFADSQTGYAQPATRIGVELDTSVYTRGLVAGADGDFYVLCYSAGAGLGVPLGSSDVILLKFSPDLEREWVRRVGSSVTETAECLTVGPAGALFVGFDTEGSVVGTSSGDQDGVVMSFPPWGYWD